MSDSLLPTNLVACSEGHGPVFFRDDLDCCPCCKEISKRLTEVNERDIKIAKLESILEGLAT